MNVDLIRYSNTLQISVFEAFQSVLDNTLSKYVGSVYICAVFSLPLTCDLDEDGATFSQSFDEDEKNKRFANYKAQGSGSLIFVFYFLFQKYSPKLCFFFRIFSEHLIFFENSVLHCG